jgi:primase-polymerase (primpol)-like protein
VESSGVSTEKVQRAAVAEILPVRTDGVPDEMKVRPQWVLWRLEERAGKPTKVPYSPHGLRQRASSTDLTTWGTFEEVLALLEHYDGIGFVFCSADPYTGVDLDGCRDPHTSELEPWAAEIVAALDSYTELSPSGTGVHIICKAKIPRGGRRGQIEMYAQDRFFTVTGHPLGAISGMEAG